MERKPKIVVFAGPNGSGKTSISTEVKKEQYINADDIKKAEKLSDLEAAVKAEKLRENALAKMEDFSFETVLSTERNLNLLRRAKAAGYFIRGFYVLTRNADINVARVKARAAIGGHDVPEDKIRTRFQRAMKLLPSFIEVCDICSVYDNSLHEPLRIYKKYHGDIVQENSLWSRKDIFRLIYGIDLPE